MEDPEIAQLKADYVKVLNKYMYLPLKYTGFCRFEVVNNEIVQLTRKTVIYNSLLLFTGNCSVFFLIYSSIFLGNYLQIPDGICVIHFGIFSNIMVLNLTFLNKSSGVEIIDLCIKSDIYFGIKDTEFIRKTVIKTYVMMIVVVFLSNVCGGIFLFWVYKVTVSIHIVGSLYFFWLFFAYDDYCLLAILFIRIAMKVRYLNVALIKYAEIEEEFVPSQSLFYYLFWDKKFDDLVQFHKRAGIEEFNRAFRMCFDMLRIIERFFKFSTLYGIWTIVMGSFIAVQTFIMRVKHRSAMDKEHTYIIVGWVVLSWLFIILTSILVDLFSKQLRQTKFICSCIRLTPNKSEEVYKLTKSVLGTLSVRPESPKIYGIFTFNMGFLFRIAASTMLYITMQLQLAFPRISLANDRILNETNLSNVNVM